MDNSEYTANAATPKARPRFSSCQGHRRTGAEWQQHSRQNRIWTGAFIMLVGVAALVRYSLPDAPAWLFSWQMLLVALGLFLGFRHSFRSGPWFVLLLIGGIFLAVDFAPNTLDRRLIWPVALIAVGLFIIIRPGRRGFSSDSANDTSEMDTGNPSPPLLHFDEPASRTGEDVIESTSVFGGIKKNILSKNFRGGEVVNVMGGTELNLSQADINGTVVLEVTQIFGGTKIIVPQHWNVKPEMAAVFGGIDDKRPLQPGVADPNKVLLLKGTSVFAGIEIKSF